MAKRLTGVALAAVMACGWAGGAQAAPFTIDFTIPNSSLFAVGSPYGITTADFPVSGSATLEYQTYNVARLEAFSLTIGSKSFDASDFNGIDNIYGAAGDTRNPTGFIIYDIVNGAQDIGIVLQVDGLNQGGGFNISTKSSPRSDVVGCTSCVSATLASGSISVVPLPSSAPLFGVALLGLAAMGYGVRRKQAA